MISRQLASTIGEAAKLLGVSERTVHSWRSRGCDIGDSERGYDIVRIKRWRADNVGDRYQRTNATEADKRKLIAESRLAEERLRKLRYANEQTEARLLPREEVERRFVECVARLFNRIRTLPGRVADIAPAEVQATVERMLGEFVPIVLKEASDAVLFGESVKSLILRQAARIDEST